MSRRRRAYADVQDFDWFEQDNYRSVNSADEPEPERHDYVAERDAAILAKTGYCSIGTPPCTVVPTVVISWTNEKGRTHRVGACERCAEEVER